MSKLDVLNTANRYKMLALWMTKFEFFNGIYETVNP